MLNIRKVTADDKAALLVVEQKSTPKLQYLPQVFEMFLNDVRGEFMLAELDGEIVACAKFTVLANASAWVETLRVIPEVQGRGIGKKLYERFAEVAEQENISVMRMYTGLKNKVSKGLAEYSGFALEETFLGFTKNVEGKRVASKHDFVEVRGVARAHQLIEPNLHYWNNFSIMNRTFYKLNSDQISHFVKQGQVYENSNANSLIICGARFMPEQALHIAFFSGDSTACLDFATAKVIEIGTKQLSCFCPISSENTKDILISNGFQESPSPFIVMKKG